MHVCTYATLNERVKVLQQAISESRTVIEEKPPDYVSLATRPKTGKPVSLRWMCKPTNGKKGDLL